MDRRMLGRRSVPARKFHSVNRDAFDVDIEWSHGLTNKYILAELIESKQDFASKAVSELQFVVWT